LKRAGDFENARFFCTEPDNPLFRLFQLDPAAHRALCVDGPSGKGALTAAAMLLAEPERFRWFNGKGQGHVGAARLVAERGVAAFEAAGVSGKWAEGERRQVLRLPWLAGKAKPLLDYCLNGPQTDEQAVTAGAVPAASAAPASEATAGGGGGARGQQMPAAAAAAAGPGGGGGALERGGAADDAGVGAEEPPLEANWGQFDSHHVTVSAPREGDIVSVWVGRRAPGAAGGGVPPSPAGWLQVEVLHAAPSSRLQKAQMQWGGEGSGRPVGWLVKTRGGRHAILALRASTQGQEWGRSHWYVSIRAGS
jgi:hypothetical protein